MPACHFGACRGKRWHGRHSAAAEGEADAETKLLHKNSYGLSLRRVWARLRERRARRVDLTRFQCRQCLAPRAPAGKAASGAQAGSRKAPAPSSEPRTGQAASSATSFLAAAKRAGRPPAPEASLAETEAQAAALDEAAAKLRTSGLEARASALEEEAAQLRKRAETAPPPGRRLDSLEAFVKRAEVRATNAEKEVKDAEAVAEKAREALKALEDELAEGRAKLVQLRADLAAAPVAETAVPEDSQMADGVTATLSDLQAELAAVIAERDALRGAEPRGQPSSDALPADVPSLERELTRLQNAISAAQASEDVDAYDRAASEHAAVASALARAMRQRKRG